MKDKACLTPFLGSRGNPLGCGPTLGRHGAGAAAGNRKRAAGRMAKASGLAPSSGRCFAGRPRLRRLSTNAATVPWTSRSGPVRRCRSVDVFRGGSQCAGQSVRGATQRDLRPQRGPAVGTHSVCAGQTAQMVRTTTSVLRRGRQVATAGGIPNARTAPSTSLAGVTTGDVRVAARSTTRRLYGAGPLSHRQPPRLGGCAAPLKLLP